DPAAAAAADHREGHQRGERLLAAGQARVLRHHQPRADGLREDQRHLRHPGEEEAGRRRRVLDLRLRPLQGVRGVRHRLRRAPGAADGAGDGRCERGARNRHRVPRPPAGYVAEVPRPLQRRAAAGFENRDPAQHADGPAQLRRAGLGRRRLRRLRREEHPAGDRRGVQRLADLKARSQAEYDLFRQAVAHLLMGLGGEDDKDTRARMADHGEISDRDIVDALTAVMRQEAFNHKNLQAIDGRLPNGMSVMAMAAHTGCNTVYGSTPPNNPHPYPWMNSLFQDGITVGWLLGESFIVDHARRSVVPERLGDALLHRTEAVITPREYYEFVHFSDNLMTD